MATQFEHELVKSAIEYTNTVVKNMYDFFKNIDYSYYTYLIIHFCSKCYVFFANGCNSIYDKSPQVKRGVDFISDSVSGFFVEKKEPKPEPWLNNTRVSLSNNKYTYTENYHELSDSDVNTYKTLYTISKNSIVNNADQDDSGIVIMKTPTQILCNVYHKRIAEELKVSENKSNVRFLTVE